MPSLIDASSAIYAWENYPIEIFPDLWEWLEQQVESKEIQCIKLIMDEIKHKSPECFGWLEKRSINIISIDDSITQKSYAIGKNLDLNDGKYGTGVGENDIFLIGSAVVTINNVISNEAIQTKPPLNKSKYKIPLVCKQESVQCYSFISYLRAHWESV